MSKDQAELTERNRELMRAAYEAFARGEVSFILGVLDPNVEWTDAEGFPYAGTHWGPDAVKAQFGRIGSEWDRFEAIPSDFIADGDHVVVLGEYNVTYKATGKSADKVPFAHVWRLKDEKIIRLRQFTDGPPFNGSWSSLPSQPHGALKLPLCSGVDGSFTLHGVHCSKSITDHLTGMCWFPETARSSTETSGLRPNIRRLVFTRSA